MGESRESSGCTAEQISELHERIRTLEQEKESLKKSLDLANSELVKMKETSKKETLEALRRSEERYRQIVESARDGIFRTDEKGRFVYVNEVTTRITGYGREDLIGRDYRKFVREDCREAVHAVLKKQYDEKTPYQYCEYAIARKDGREMWLGQSTQLVMRGEEIVGFQAVAHDLTDRKSAEDALKKAEEKYRLLVNNARDAILIIQDGMIKFTNPRLVEILGYAEDELYEHAITKFIHEEDRELVMELHFKRLNGNDMPGGATFRGYTKTGAVIWLDVTAVSVEWEGRTAGLYFLRDISQQRLLEGQLVQAQKMEAVGTLAGGIAHDFNNILMGIQGQTFLTLMNMNSNHPDYQKLKSIENLVSSGARITGQLLGFARVGKFETKLVSLNNLMEKSISLFGATKKDITVQKAFQETIWSVEADEVQIEQVLLNMYINAWHAMPGGGELFLETQNIFLNDVDVNPFSVAPGRYVKMAVTDTGMGMDEKTRERIFEPFFTTKEPDKGTGLGLTSAYSIIRNHGGFITVNSWPGKGTSFNVFLPASFKKDDAVKDAVREISKGSGTILVVDDEKTNLDVTRELLERWGYTVLTADKGQDAVAIYEKEHSNVDLVLLDMIMPGMSGERTFELLQQMEPKVRIIVCSGYSMGSQAKRLMERGCLGYIQKPYHFDQFLRKIDEAMKGKQDD